MVVERDIPGSTEKRRITLNACADPNWLIRTQSSLDFIEGDCASFGSRAPVKLVITEIHPSPMEYNGDDELELPTLPDDNPVID